MIEIDVVVTWPKLVLADDSRFTSESHVYVNREARALAHKRIKGIYPEAEIEFRDSLGSQTDYKVTSEPLDSDASGIVIHCVNSACDEIRTSIENMKQLPDGSAIRKSIL